MHEHEPEKRIDMNSELGISRRDLIRRGAVIGGALVWVAPAIQSMAPKALAQVGGPGSVTCTACYCWTGNHDHPPNETGTFGLATEGDCDTFCQNQDFPGQAEIKSEFCMGTDCDIQTGPTGSAQHGAFCS
jgi:hypothetical protein